MRLDKFLCDMQLGTRNQVKEYIRKGTVSVNDMIIKKPDFKLDEKKDAVAYLGKLLVYQSTYYYMLHKPAGVVTATSDNQDKTVMDLLTNAAGKDLFPVGRLDKDTEGLLLITNDGELAHNLLSPRKHVAKTYYAECSGSINEEKIKILETGVDIGDDALTLPAKAELLSQTGSAYTIKLTITEGRFHQVKRMIEAVGGCVTYLKRLSMGPLLLDEALPKGTYRPLTEQEIADLTSYNN
ncbi:MAG: rRNA pseudouridine synthase [Lachnospiraceae bacterium]|nr:rRNA pseudouridine synthase [Lachnospiraceae bacterium]